MVRNWGNGGESFDLYQQWRWRVSGGGSPVMETRRRIGEREIEEENDSGLFLTSQEVQKCKSFKFDVDTSNI